MAVMEKGEAIDNEEPTAKFEVAASDVDAGWDLVMLSFEAQKNFKVNIVLVPCLTDVLCFYVRWQSEKNLRRRLRRRRLQEDYWMTRKLQRTLSGLGSRRLKLSMIESMKMMESIIISFRSLFEYLQLLVSVMRRDRLHPTLPGVNVDVFVKVWN